MDISRKPGWYGQPGLLPGQKRYWDGQRWTERVSLPRAGSSAGWGVVLAVFIIGAVAFGLLNALMQFSRT